MASDPSAEALPTAVAKVVAEIKADDKPVAKAKPKAPKEKESKAPKSSKPSSHPTYLSMVVEAIAALKDRTGSSQPAIAKFVEEKYKAGLPANFKKQLAVQLKKFSHSGKLVQVKHSYKLSDALKKPVAKKTSSAATTKNPVKVTKLSVKAKATRPGKSRIVKAAKQKIAMKPVNPKHAGKSNPKSVKPVSVKKSVKKAAPARKKAAPARKKAAAATTKTPASKKASPAPKKAMSVKKVSGKKAPAVKKGKVSAA